MILVRLPEIKCMSCKYFLRLKIKDFLCPVATKIWVAFQQSRPMIEILAVRNFRELKFLPDIMFFEFCLLETIDNFCYLFK